MKATCPNCRTTIPAADVALDKGWARCAGCDEVFPLEQLLPGYSSGDDPARVPPRPFDAFAVVRREPALLAVHVPARGMRAQSWATLVFAIVWLTFLSFWCAGTGFLFQNAGPFRWVNLIFVAFSIPFWVVGFGMLGSVVWMSRGTRNAMIDAGRMVTELRCGFWRRTRAVDRDQVQCARPGEQLAKREGAAPTPAVEIVHTAGAFKLPCSTVAERSWLVAEINDFLKRVPYDPAQRDWPAEPRRSFAP